MTIDIVRYGSYRLLVFSDDGFYKYLPAQDKHLSIYDLEKEDVFPQPDPKLALDQLDPRTQAFEMCIAHYCRTFDRLNVCDIGAHYGIVAMDLARVVLSNGGNAEIFAFDPGAASELTWRNFELNHFDITFERAAVGPINGHAPMFMEHTESTNNRLINQHNASTLEGTVVPVKCLRLDTYLSSRSAMRPSCIKIDVQGAEPAVIAGMPELLAAHPVTIQLEFTPWAMQRTGIDPAAFLQRLMETHHIYDIGHVRQHLLPVNDAVTAIQRIGQGAPYWADVLAIPKALSGVEGLLARLPS